MHSILFPADTYQVSLRRRFGYFGYALVIILGMIPGARSEVGEVASSFFLHFTTYAFIAALLFTGQVGSAARRVWRTVIIVSLMGALDEFIQSFLPYRHGTIHDWYVDVAAALITAAILAQSFVKAQRRAIAGTHSPSDAKSN
ncbi:VanZ family protein [Noviherbaspirillum aerium]|uniref:VanZ family protein n=1 Tax=Noviherbaspirillum aerium TaxID=2588497 RepID=UPI00124CDB8E|nr:VanZ family protein [Noviherbaspirillum aerium]